MGGSGSGRWSWHDRKSTVEDSLVLSAGKLARDGVIAQGAGAGALRWTNSVTGEQTASAGYSREGSGDRIILRLRYTVTRHSGEKYDIGESIALQTTPSAVGGVRWWFVCPLVVNGRDCARRVGKLVVHAKLEAKGHAAKVRGRTRRRAGALPKDVKGTAKQAVGKLTGDGDGEFAGTAGWSQNRQARRTPACRSRPPSRGMVRVSRRTVGRVVGREAASALDRHGPRRPPLHASRLGIVRHPSASPPVRAAPEARALRPTVVGPRCIRVGIADGLTSRRRRTVSAERDDGHLEEAWRTRDPSGG